MSNRQWRDRISPTERVREEVPKVPKVSPDRKSDAFGTFGTSVLGSQSLSAEPFGTFGTPPLTRLQLLPKVTIPPGKLAEFQAAIDEITQAGFEITALRDGSEDARGIPEAQWRADQLNRIFKEHGTAGPGRIKPSTVKDGMLKQGRTCAECVPRERKLE